MLCREWTLEVREQKQAATLIILAVTYDGLNQGGVDGGCGEW